MIQIVVLVAVAPDCRVMYRVTSDDPQVIKQEQKGIAAKLDQLDMVPGIHTLTTDDGTVASLVDKDPYFEGVEDTNSWADFETRVTQMSRLTTTEVAAYMIHKYHLSLHQRYAIQKTLYYLYADHIATEGRLFEGQFVAYDRGPVDSKLLNLMVHDPKRINRSRFLFHEKIGVGQKRTQVLTAIDETVDKYLPFFEQEPLVSDPAAKPTHRPGTPWQRAYQQGQNTVIDDDLIRRYHYLEEI